MGTNFLPANVPPMPSGTDSISQLKPWGDALAATLNVGQNASVQIRGAWAVDNTYDVNDQVIYGSNEYRSLIASNIGNQPDTSPSAWKAVLGAVTIGNHIIVPVKTAVASNIAATTERLEVTATGNTIQTLPNTRPATFNGKITVKNRGSGTITMAATSPTTMEMGYTIGPYQSYDFDLDTTNNIWMGV